VLGTTSNVVATVNQDKITTSQMYDAMQHFVPLQVPNSQLLQQPAGRTALQMLIENTLMVQLAKNQGVPVTAKEVDARYQDLEMVQDAKSTQPFDKVLELQGYTPDSFKAALVTPEVARFNIETKSLSASPSELNSFYNSNKQSFELPDRAHIERVVLADKPTAISAYTESCTRHSFGKYAEQSLAPAENGAVSPGDMLQWVYLNKPDAGLKSVVELIKAAKPGDTLNPVQVGGAWWVVRVVEKKTAQTLDYKDVTDMVRWDFLSQQASRQGADQTLQDDLRVAAQTANISIKPAQYQDLAAQFKAPQPSLAGPSAAPVTIPGGPKGQ
jgi:parvulin-like peptidyl-prolyl isomerase